jgi:hypothetical protein
MAPIWLFIAIFVRQSALFGESDTTCRKSHDLP